MFGVQSGYASLSEEQRKALASMLEDRNTYMEHGVKLNELRIIALRDGTPESEERVNDYASTVVAPLRKAVAAKANALIVEGIDLDGLKSVLPMIGLALLGSVNLPLLMNASGVDEDMITEFTDMLSQYLKQGM